MPTDAEAQQEVAAWRGHCLNFFARGEMAIGVTLREADAPKLRHLAGQRLDDLVRIASQTESTEKQAKAFKQAIECWQKVEGHRHFLAHGVASVSFNEKGEWTALFDVTSFRGNKPNDERLAIRQDEAENFLGKVQQAFQNLSSQLGQFRKRLAR